MIVYSQFSYLLNFNLGYNDKNGNTMQKGLKFSFAHHIILDRYDEQFLSFGLSYNINTFRIATEKDFKDVLSKIKTEAAFEP